VARFWAEVHGADIQSDTELSHTQQNQREHSEDADKGAEGSTRTSQYPTSEVHHRMPLVVRSSVIHSLAFEAIRAGLAKKCVLRHIILPSGV